MAGGSIKPRVVVASTVMLSFISFWRASAIVLTDMGSSAFYVGGIAETAIGKSAPWFILAIMLFAYAVRSLYIESCSMFVRGGVYKVVHEALGGLLAKFSVSALMFDYVLTGPISGISAGLYLAGLVNDLAEYSGLEALHVNPGSFAVLFALLATAYFWRKNTIGLHESSEKALRIMQITTVMVVIMIVWSLITIAMKGYNPVPLPAADNLVFGPEALGWLKGSGIEQLTLVAILVGMGHSLLAMSGEETLAQVNREIAAPKLRNLQRTGFIIFVYSLTFTSLVSFFAAMIIPDAERVNFLDNLIGGLAMFFVGPMWLRLLFHGFVVLVGTLMLSGAINTAIIGSNGVLNRVAEDGVLTEWFRHPHKRYGTTYRLINIIVALQMLTIVLSGGDVYLLGEAYAFGVIWSFAMKSLSVLILRYKRPGQRAWRVPLNIRILGVEIPLGLGLITATLFTLAIVNLFTKQVATISGVAFTLVFFVIFQTSEILTRRRQHALAADEEKFRLDADTGLSPAELQVRPGNILVALRNPELLHPLESVLRPADKDQADIVVLTVHPVGLAESGEHELEASQIFGSSETRLFSRVVNIAEKAGRHVELLVVSGVDACDTIVQTAFQLRSRLIVAGASSRFSAEGLAAAMGRAWEKLPGQRMPQALRIVNPDGTVLPYTLGPHAPQLWPEDIVRVHRLWIELTEREGFGASLHHRDVLHIALKRLQDALQAGDEDTLLQVAELRSLRLKERQE